MTEEIIFNENVVRLLSGILLVTGVMSSVVAGIKYFTKKSNENIDDRIDDKLGALHNNYNQLDKRVSIIETMINFLKGDRNGK